MTTLLLIEDDRKLASRLRDYLAENGFLVTIAMDGAAGLERLLSDAFDIALLDVMLPGLDGFEVLREVRKRTRVPIIMLTARGEETDRVVGLELGADDYVSKPFSPRELLARIRALLRRTGTPPEKAKLRFGDLQIDPEARTATRGAAPLPLTSLQFDLLYHLASHPGRVFSRNDLSEEIRGQEIGYADRSIDVHISRIRALVEEDPKHPRRIKTIRSVGYLFVKEPT